MRIDILENGNLRLTAEGSDELDGDYWTVMERLFEPYSTNGSFEIFDAGQANPFVGLTNAPCIAECLDTDEDGRKEVVGRLWCFTGYMVRDDLGELREKGFVEYSEVT